jgi:N-methylhydantoinase B/oxoprolinase/acetone carboxylase alpha subunit
MRRSLLDDPVTLEVMWSRLVTVADEMQSTLRRTAFSTIVGAANDLGCDILDARGWLVAHATTSNPAFNLTLPHLVQRLGEVFPPESLSPGDVLITNDPWLVVGHLPDFAVVTPFFKNGRLVGYSGSIAHVADIGGLLNLHDSRSIYEEGLQIPPLKLFEAGQRNETLVKIIERNVRAPEMVMGDTMALVAANDVAARQTLAVLDEYQLDDLESLSNAIQDRAEQAMRQAIAEIPDGDYPWRVTFDELDGPMTIGVVVRINGSDMTVDYVEAPPEHPYGGINSTLSYTLARTAYAVNCILTPQIPSNEGLFRPLTVRVPEGTALNARYPACVVDRTKVGWHTNAAIHGALSLAIPDKVPAAGGFKSLHQLIGVDDYGFTYRSLMFSGGGMGAGAEVDGVDAICYPTTSCNVPVELIEKTTSILVTEKEFLPDSGGPGRTRGGAGVRVTIRKPDDLDRPLTMIAHLHHQEHPPYGLHGGHDGTATRALVNGRTASLDEVREELGALELTDTNTHITIETAGGGGFGDPRERSPHKVLDDVRNGFVSPAAARRDYGVSVDLDHLSVERLPSKGEPGPAE